MDLKNANPGALVSPEGAPMRMFHGTTLDFDQFSIDGGACGILGQGTYFTNRPQTAANYAGREVGARIIPVYLNLQKPFWCEMPLTPDQAERIRQSGEYDGIAYRGVGGEVWAVPFHQEQIRSVFDNACLCWSNEPADHDTVEGLDRPASTV